MASHSQQHQTLFLQPSPLRTTQSFNKIAVINKKMFNLCLKIASAWSLFGIVTFAQTPVFAQSAIAPDNTLGAESSQIIPNFNRLPVEVIIGGATRGINLFHSFQEFNVSEGRGAYFFSPSVDIQNILARVTGENRSEILGTLGTFQIINGNIAGYNANLFLINPNGIIFGKSASLDVNGSFAATTANAIQFGEKGNFSASNPEVPQLLTINPSAFLFSQINKTASIQNNSVALVGVDSAGFNTIGLRVFEGKSLLLVGGDVSMDGGQLNANGGRVELGGLAEPGNINLLSDGNNFKLEFPKNVARANVSLINQARVYVQAAGGGNIAVNARNIEISGVSRLLAGIGQGLGTPETVAGDITLNASGEIKVTGVVDIAGVKNGFSSGIGSRVETGTEGNGGNISIDAGSLKLRDGALLDARTQNNNKGGNITINTNVFEALNGGQLSTTTSSNGRAGKIVVNATNKVILSGSDPNYNDRIIQFPDRVGNIGANSGFFVSSTGSGITGDIEINSPNITLDNQAKLNAESSSGNGGNINLNSNLLLLRRGAQITTNAGTAQQGGDGGNININSKFIIAIPQENSDITANAFKGRGGNVQINSQGIFGIEARSQQTEKSDITASSNLGVAGVISLTAPDTNSIQNNLAELSQNPIDTQALIANSCIARSDKLEGTFTITGAGGFPHRPGDASVSSYHTGDVRNVQTENASRPWQKGDPIVEPTGVYRLPNGQLVMSRECQNN